MSAPNWQQWIVQQAEVLNHIASNLLPVQRLITGAAYLIGLAFAFKAIVSLKSYGESRSAMSSGNANLKEPLMYILVAAIFIYLPTGVAIMLQTTFGTSSLMQYASVNSQISGINILFGSGSVVGRPLTIIIQTIGVIAFVRGWILIARTASQGQPPGGTGKGLMHVVGGILAMNIVATLEIINNTIYGTS
ncbi:MAG: type IV secretion protein IcmC [Tatlockia sp.]|nr:type IV secretion protein IcmC [Tatlockia sp.]